MSFAQALAGTPADFTTPSGVDNAGVKSFDAVSTGVSGVGQAILTQQAPGSGDQKKGDVQFTYWLPRGKGVLSAGGILLVQLPTQPPTVGLAACQYAVAAVYDGAGTAPTSGTQLTVPATQNGPTGFVITGQPGCSVQWMAVPVNAGPIPLP